MFLIVDDSQVGAEALARLLRFEGHEAVVAPGGIDALALLRQRRLPEPALIILDINMPGMDGLALLRALRNHPALKDARCVVYSFDPRPEIAAQATRLGALDYIVKGSLPVPALAARLKELAGASEF